jgi:hypothetical protein
MATKTWRRKAASPEHLPGARVIPTGHPRRKNMATFKTEATTNRPGQVDSPRHLIASDRVEGAPVINRKGEKIGTIERVMIDKLSGQVAYAVMSSGGFLGVGESYHPLPWSVLNYNPEEGGYVVDLDRDGLQRAPHYLGANEPNWSDSEWRRSIGKHYKTDFPTQSLAL